MTQCNEREGAVYVALGQSDSPISLANTPTVVDEKAPLDPPAYHTNVLSHSSRDTRPGLGRRSWIQACGIALVVMVLSFFFLGSALYYLELDGDCMSALRQGLLEGRDGLVRYGDGEAADPKLLSGTDGMGVTVIVTEEIVEVSLPVAQDPSDDEALAEVVMDSDSEEALGDELFDQLFEEGRWKELLGVVLRAGADRLSLAAAGADNETR